MMDRIFNPFLFTFIFLTSFSLTGFSQEFTGTWTGQLEMGPTKLNLIFHISPAGEIYETAMDIPAQGVRGALAGTTTVEDRQLTLLFPQFQITYEGTLNEQDEIEGKFMQAGFSIPLTLKKGAPEIRRPQEPQAPFSYYSEDVIFKSTDQVQLSGTLTLPRQGGTFPLVIIVSGSGPQNRDGEIFGHKPYLVLADHLTRNGIAVLRYDERGVGESEGNFATATIETLAGDVSAAMRYVRTRQDFKVSRLGLIGHSIGGLIAPKIASTDPSVDFLILMAGPGLNGDEVMLSQKADYERKLGIPEPQIAQGRELIKGAYDLIIRSGLEGASLKDSIHNFYIRKYGAMIPADQRETIVNQLTNSSEVIGLIRSRPAEYLEKVHCPVLALNGDKDFQVLSSENLPAIEQAIRKNGNTRVTTMELKDINHLFQESDTGLLDEYSRIEQTIAPSVLTLITDWIRNL